MSLNMRIKESSGTAKNAATVETVDFALTATGRRIGLNEEEVRECMFLFPDSKACVREYGEGRM